MLARGRRREGLGGQLQPALFPFGIAGPRFLLAADVDACSVDFVVAALLEATKDAVVRVEGCDAGAGCSVRAMRLVSAACLVSEQADLPKGHAAQNHTGLASGGRDKRHLRWSAVCGLFTQCELEGK